MSSLSFDDWLYEDMGERVPSPTSEARLFSPPTPRFEPRRTMEAPDSVPPLEDLVSELPDAEDIDEELASRSKKEELASELDSLDVIEGDKLDGLKAVIEDALATLTPGAKPASGSKRSFSSSEERPKGVKAPKKAKGAEPEDEEKEDGPAQVCTYVCRFSGCGKSYASTDAVRKHCRQRHLEWLRALGHGTPELYCNCIVSPAE